MIPAETEIYSPVAENRRLIVPDVLRGVAVCGMLLTNILAHAYPGWEGTGVAENISSIYDTVALTLIGVFVGGKFFTIFSILFGFGIALQFDRHGNSGGGFTRIFQRRLAVLFVIGIIHGMLFFSADILAFYAILGFFAIPFRNMSVKNSAISISAFLAIAIIVLSILSAKKPEFFSKSEPDWDRLSGERRSELTVADDGNSGLDSGIDQDITLRFYRFMADESRIYSSGSLAEITLHRSVIYLVIGMPLRLGLVTWRCFPMILLGTLFYRMKILIENILHKKTYKYFIIFGFITGLSAHGVFLTDISNSSNTLPALIMVTCLVAGPILMALAYIGVVALLCSNHKYSPVTSILASVGRLALSNYLGQSVICVFIFNSYGLGLYGQLSPLVSIVIALLAQVVLTALSVIWLKGFYMGPVEWIWRWITYGKIRNFRRV